MLRTTQKGLAEVLGIAPETVSRWDFLPTYAEAYVRAEVRAREADRLRERLRQIAEIAK